MSALRTTASRMCKDPSFDDFTDGQRFVRVRYVEHTHAQASDDERVVAVDEEETSAVIRQHTRIDVFADFGRICGSRDVAYGDPQPAGHEQTVSLNN